MPVENSDVALDEETSRHVIQVLRMQPGERILLTDGQGNTAEASISAAHKKHCTAQIIARKFFDRPPNKTTIAISLVKNSSRFEWFLEKATELGTAEIIPLLCERTERQKFRHDRMLNICKSAMLQSMQAWLPILHEPVSFTEVIGSVSHQQKFIAHCADDEKNPLLKLISPSPSDSIILIGPEGDFSPGEIAAALDKSFVAVSLGSTRLRTETAGLYAAVALNGGR